MCFIFVMCMFFIRTYGAKDGGSAFPTSAHAASPSRLTRCCLAYLVCCRLSVYLSKIALFLLSRLGICRLLELLKSRLWHNSGKRAEV